MLLEMQYKSLKLFLHIAVDAYRLTVPIDPNRHENTINRFGAGGIG